MHQLVLPSIDCYRLGHRIDERRKQPGPGKWQFCAVCSLGYEMAMSRFNNDEGKADQFVQALRRERHAGPVHHRG